MGFESTIDWKEACFFSTVPQLLLYWNKIDNHEFQIKNTIEVTGMEPTASRQNPKLSQFFLFQLRRWKYQPDR